MGTLLRFDRMLPVAAMLAALAALLRGEALVILLITAVAVVWVAAGVRAHRPHPLLGGLLLAAAGTAGLAMAAWSAPIVAGGAATGLAQPSLADAGFLLSHLLLAGALLMAVGHRERPFFVVLDTLTLAAAVGLVAGVALIGPHFASAAAPPALRLTRLAYVVADVVVLAVVLRAILAPRRRPPALWPLGAAGAALVASDLAWSWLTVRGEWTPGTWAAAGWVLAPLLAGLGVLHPSLRGLRRRDEHAGSELRSAAVVLLGAVLLVAPLTLGAHGVLAGLDSPRGAVALMLVGSGLSALVVLRFALLLRHTRRLADERARLLDTAEARHRALIEQLPAITVLFRLDREARRVTPVYVSPQTDAMLGIPAAQWHEDFARVLARVEPDDLADLRRTVGELVATGASAPVELRTRGADDAQLWLGGMITGDESGAYVQTVLFDITDAKRAAAEQERLERELRLAQKLEAVGQLAAGIAHEINTPTQFVGDTVRFLKTAFEDVWALQEAQAAVVRSTDADADLVARVREAEEMADLDYLRERVPPAFERAIEGIRRVGAIVAAMREFAHPPTAEMSAVDVNAGLRNTLVVATGAYKYVADVVTDLDELPRVLGHGGDLNQVFLNLIVNAAHAIETRNRGTGERGTISVRTRADDDHVTVSIADTGCGMTPDVAERVFDPFFTTKEVGRGTGQGLAIARALVVERHGGTLTFETAPGDGSTFHVRLPLERRAAAQEVAA